MADTWTAGPRIGFAYDLSGTGRSVVKGYYGRFYFNSADIVADTENPVGDASLRYRMTDLNGNRLLDGPQELGVFLQTVGGAGFVRVGRNLKRPYGEELSGHFEQEVMTACRRARRTSTRTCATTGRKSTSRASANTRARSR